jgi:hypothetical protein
MPSWGARADKAAAKAEKNNAPFRSGRDPRPKGAQRGVTRRDNQSKNWNSGNGTRGHERSWWR